MYVYVYRLLINGYYTPYNVHYTPYTIRHTLYAVHYTPCNVQCSLVHCVLSNPATYEMEYIGSFYTIAILYYDRYCEDIYSVILYIAVDCTQKDGVSMA